MQGWLSGKAALVTGGASGIGEAVVERFIAEQARVCVLDLNRDAVRLLGERWGDRLVAVDGDVRLWADNVRAVRRAIEVFGRLDIFVGNAGVFDGFVRLVDLPGEAVAEVARDVFDVNVTGYLLGARAAVEELVRNRGNMIFTVSNAGNYAGGGGAVYTASKHAVVGIIRQLAYELSPKVRVNGVAPGGTLTNMQVAAGLRKFVTAESGTTREGRIRKANPLGIVMQPGDHAAAYVLLASDQAPAITGAVIESDGGLGVRGLWSTAGAADV